MWSDRKVARSAAGARSRTRRFGLVYGSTSDWSVGRNGHKRDLEVRGNESWNGRSFKDERGPRCYSLYCDVVQYCSTVVTTETSQQVLDNKSTSYSAS